MKKQQILTLILGLLGGSITAVADENKTATQNKPPINTGDSVSVILEKIQNIHSATDDEKENRLSEVEKQVRKLVTQAEELQEKQPSKAYQIYQQAVAITDKAITDGKQTEQAEYDILYATDAYAQNIVKKQKEFSLTKLLKTQKAKNAELQQALDFINLGFKYGFGMPEDHPYRDASDFEDFWETKAELLSMLGKSSETFEIVAAALELDSEPYQHQSIFSISKTDEFKKWYEARPRVLKKSEKALLKKSAHILQNMPVSVIPKGVDKTNSKVRFEVVNFATVVKDYGFENIANKNSKTLLVLGDYYSNESITDDWLKQQSERFNEDIEGVTFANNVYVNGRVESLDFMLLQVNGSLFVDDAILFNSGTIQVNGDTHTKYGMCGGYGCESSMYLSGKIYSPYFIVAGDAMPTSSEQEHIVLDSSEDRNYLFKQEVFGEDEYLSTYNFFALLRKGVNPFISQSNCRVKRIL